MSNNNKESKSENKKNMIRDLPIFSEECDNGLNNPGDRNSNIKNSKTKRSNDKSNNQSGRPLQSNNERSDITLPVQCVNESTGQISKNTKTPDESTSNVEPKLDQKQLKVIQNNENDKNMNLNETFQKEQTPATGSTSTSSTKRKHNLNELNRVEIEYDSSDSDYPYYENEKKTPDESTSNVDPILDKKILKVSKDNGNDDTNIKNNKNKKQKNKQFFFSDNGGSGPIHHIGKLYNGGSFPSLLSYWSASSSSSSSSSASSNNELEISSEIKEHFKDTPPNTLSKPLLEILPKVNPNSSSSSNDQETNEKSWRSNMTNLKKKKESIANIFHNTIVIFEPNNIDYQIGNGWFRVHDVNTEQKPLPPHTETATKEDIEEYMDSFGSNKGENSLIYQDRLYLINRDYPELHEMSLSSISKYKRLHSVIKSNPLLCFLKKNDTNLFIAARPVLEHLSSFELMMLYVLLYDDNNEYGHVVKFWSGENYFNSQSEFDTAKSIVSKSMKDLKTECLTKVISELSKDKENQQPNHMNTQKASLSSSDKKKRKSIATSSDDDSDSSRNSRSSQIKESSNSRSSSTQNISVGTSQRLRQKRFKSILDSSDDDDDDINDDDNDSSNGSSSTSHEKSSTKNQTNNSSSTVVNISPKRYENIDADADCCLIPPSGKYQDVTGINCVHEIYSLKTSFPINLYYEFFSIECKKKKDDRLFLTMDLEDPQAKVMVFNVCDCLSKTLPRINNFYCCCATIIESENVEQEPFHRAFPLDNLGFIMIIPLSAEYHIKIISTEGGPEEEIHVELGHSIVLKSSTPFAESESKNKDVKVKSIQLCFYPYLDNEVTLYNPRIKFVNYSTNITQPWKCVEIEEDNVEFNED